MAKYDKNRPTLKEIKSIEGNKLREINYEELLPIAKYASKLAIKRREDFIKKAKEKGIKTTAPSFRQWSSEHDNFSSYLEYDFSLNDIDFSNKEKRLGQLKHKFKMIRDFLSNETSLFSQWEKLMEDFAERVEVYSAINITKRNYNLLWDIYNNISHLSKTNTSYDSTQLQKEITQIILNFNDKDSKKARQDYKIKHNISSNVRLNTEELKLAYIEYLENKITGKYEEEQVMYNEKLDEPENPNSVFRGARKGR